MATGTVRAEEADLVYDYDGTGPVLLAIAGGGGGGARYAAISAALADEYRVVWRPCSPTVLLRYW
jgi:hypothetical protein